MKSIRARMLISLASIIAGGCGGALGDPARIEVFLDRAEVMRMPDTARTIIIGNPAIADVTVLKNRTMILTGKGYGSTNLIAVDDQGKAISEATISVHPAEDRVLVLQRGMNRESYSCTPGCMPLVSLGDAQTYSSEAQTGIKARNDLINPSSK